MSSNYANQLIVAKYLQFESSDIHYQNQSRHAIGYIVSGTKYIHNGGNRSVIPKGNIFYMGLGAYYMQEIAEPDRPFEQIVFYYTSEQLSKVLSMLSLSFQINIENRHSCSRCKKSNYITLPASPWLRTFFTATNSFIKEDLFSNNHTAESLQLQQLVALIMMHPDSCLKSKLIENADTQKDNFEQIIQQYIFVDISIDELAQKTNRSLTSFKNEFKRHFFETPHKWFIKQRLMHSRLLLISTNKSISEIGSECNFLNTSHFIKLFKKEFKLTPANYRARHKQEVSESIPSI